MNAMLKIEALVAWKKGRDVICPLCGTHIEEGDEVVYRERVFHPVCLANDKQRAQRRIAIEFSG